MNFKKKLSYAAVSGVLTATLIFTHAFAFPAIYEDDQSEFNKTTEIEEFESVADPNISVYADGIKVEFDEDIRIENDRTLVPMRAIFEALGADVSWNEASYSAYAVMNDVSVSIKINDNTMFKSVFKDSEDSEIIEEIELDAPARMFGERTLVPLRAISEAFGSYVDWDAPSRTVFVDSRENSMQGTVISDDYRYPNYNGEFNTINIFDKEQSDFFGMELLNISDEQGTRYADIVNSFASAVPNARVYNIIAPTSAEFYANDKYKTHYTPAIHKIYSQLDNSVTSINIVSNLMAHADENIYFHTDHHWTQLGAYYAYEAFINSLGESIDPYISFESQTIENYNGSLINFTRGTDGEDLLKRSPDSLTLCSPKVSYTGKSYNDMEMKDYIKDMLIINPGFENYSCFIEGDYPVTVFDTDVDNGKSLVIIKESYGDAFATWAVNNFERVYIIDYRKFNNYGGRDEASNVFKISEFQELTGFTDLLILSYPVTVANTPETTALRAMAE